MYFYMRVKQAVSHLKEKSRLHSHVFYPADGDRTLFCNSGKKVKVNQSRYWPGVAQRVPGS
jgi:hypothetical protein